MVRREIVPPQAALEREIVSHLPTVLNKPPFLHRHPGGIVSEAQFAVSAEGAKERVRKRRGRCRGAVRSVERECPVQIVADAGRRARSYAHLVAVIFTILLDPKTNLDQMSCAQLCQSVLEDEYFPNASRGIRQAANGVKSVDIDRRNLARDIFACIPEDIWVGDPEGRAIKAAPDVQIDVYYIFGRGEREVVQKCWTEVGGQVHRRAAFRKFGVDLKQLAASRSSPGRQTVLRVVPQAHSQARLHPLPVIINLDGFLPFVRRAWNLHDEIAAQG